MEEEALCFLKINFDIKIWPSPNDQIWFARRRRMQILENDKSNDSDSRFREALMNRTTTILG